MKNDTVTGLKWSTVSTVWLAIVGIIKISVLTRFLESSDFGLMALVSFVLGFTNLFMDMGLTSAILHMQEISRNEYASLFWVNILFSLFLYGIVLLLSPFIGAFYIEAELSVLIPIMAISIILSAFGNQFKTIEQKRLNFRYLALTDILGASVGLTVAIICAFKGYGVYALVYSALGQYAFTNSMYFINGFRAVGLVFHFRYAETKPFLKIGVYQVGGQMANYFNRDLDILLIGKFFGSEMLGGYSLAKQLVQRPIQIINPIISKVASPILAKMQNNMEQLRAQFLSIINLVATISFIAYLMLVVLAYPAVYILFGKEFLHIVVVVRILSIYMFLNAVGNPVGSLLIATGKTHMDLYWNVFALIIGPIAIYIGSQYSIVHVAWCLSMSSVMLLYPFWKLLVFNLCEATAKDFFLSYIPKLRLLSKVFRGE